MRMTVGERRGREWVMSLERLDEKMGYVKGNVALVCLEFNTWGLSTSSWTAEKVQIVRDFLELKASWPAEEIL